MYTRGMQITATHLRKNLFQCMLQAKQGQEIVITHKGDRYRLVPEKPVSKLDRITPIEYFNPEVTDEDWERTKLEMQAEWEENTKKWFPDEVS